MSWAWRPFVIPSAASGQLTDAGNIASSEVLGQPALVANLNSTAIVGAEAFGSPTVSVGTFLTDAGGIASAEALGVPGASVTASPAGVASVAAYGQPSIGATASPSGVASQEEIGVPSLSASVSPTSIASAEILGEPIVTQTALLENAGDIPTAEAFGNPTVTPTVLLENAGAIPTGEAHGQHAVAAAVFPAGVLTEELFGTQDVSVVYAAVGAESSEAFGTPELGEEHIILAHGIPSGEALGTGNVPVQWVVFGVIRDRKGTVISGADIHLCSADAHVMVAHGFSDSNGKYRFATSGPTERHFLTGFYGDSPRRASVTTDNLKGKPWTET